MSFTSRKVPLRLPSRSVRLALSRHFQNQTMFRTVSKDSHQVLSLSECRVCLPGVSNATGNLGDGSLSVEYVVTEILKITLSKAEC